MKLSLHVFSILLAVALAGAVEPGAPLEKASTPTPMPRTVPPQIMTAESRAAALLRAGQLLDADHVATGLQSPTHEKLALPAPSRTALRGREIAERARAGYLRVGWYYHCSECGNWHLFTAGGYSIATNALATACHVLEPPAKMRPGEAYLIAIRGESEVLPVQAIVAADKETDAVVLRVGGASLTPLSLADDLRVGDPVYCLSDPHGIRGYFSSGVVDRLFSTRPAAGMDARYERLNVSTDWAPGSSGAAILDECGNVAGHVARISSLFNDPHAPEAADHPPARPATLMNLHEAVPAKSVLALLAR